MTRSLRDILGLLAGLAVLLSLAGAPRAQTSVLSDTPHTSDISAIAISADGKLVLTGSEDKTIKLWDADTLRLIRTYTWDDEQLEKLAFSPDARRFLAIGKTLGVWSVDTETPQFVIDSRLINAGASFLDNNVIISFGYDGLARIDARSGRITKRITASKLWNHDMQLAADGKTGLSIGKREEDKVAVFNMPRGDNQIDIFDIANGKRKRRISTAFRFEDHQISPNGRLIAVEDIESKAIVVLDLERGAEIQRIAPTGREFDWFSFVGNGSQLALYTFNEFKVVDATTGTKVGNLKGGRNLKRWALFPNGREIFGTYYNKIGKVEVDLATQAKPTAVKETLSDLIRATTQLRVNPAEPKSFAYTGNNKLAIVYDQLSAITFLDLISQDRVRSVTFPDPSHGTPARFDTVWAGGTSNSLIAQSWSTIFTASAETNELKSTAQLHGAGGQIAISADGQKILAERPSSDNAREYSCCLLFDVSNTREQKQLTIGAPKLLESLALSGDGTLALIGTNESEVRIVDLNTGRSIHQYRHSALEDYDDTQCAAISSDGSLTASVAEDNSLIVHKRGKGGFAQMFKAKVQDQVLPLHCQVTFSPDGQFVATGTHHGTVKVWSVSSGTLVHTLAGAAGQVHLTAHSPDGRRIAGGDTSGITLWDAASGDKLARLTFYPNNEWVLITPEGYFDASRNGAQQLTIVRGTEVLSIDRMYQTLYRPDLVLQKLAGDPDGIVREAASKLDLEKVSTSGSAPTIAIVPPAAASIDSDQIKVEAEITDSGGGIGRVEWKVNGVTQGSIDGKRGLARVEGQAPASQPGTTKKVSQDLSLEPGENVIELVAYNSANLVASQPVSFKLTLAEDVTKTLPTLYVLAIGINDYYDSRMRLTYAVPDATAMSSALQRAGAGHYDDVEVKTLTDAQVTTAGIEAAFDEFSKKVRPRDVMVFFAAGHGKTVDGRYYFLPRNFRYVTEASITEAGIGQEQWQAWFAKIAARKSILIYDTCESGSLTSEGARQVAVLTRSGLEHQAAVGRLIQATGRTVLTAATSDRPALEGYRGHGVFTYALLDGLAKADRNGNGLIEVTELAGYVDAVVPEITHKAFGTRQLPQMSLQGSDFAVTRKIEGLVADEETSPPIPTKPTHVVFDAVKVFKEARDFGPPALELKPGTAFAVVETENGWALIARDGTTLGYVEEAKVQPLQ